MGVTRAVPFWATLVLVAVAPVLSGRPQPVEAAGGVLQVATTADFQHALDIVEPGQTILLEPGRVYEGPFRLRRKEGDEWITIRTATPDREFVRPGRRVRPQDARDMPRLIAAGGSVLTTEPGAHHYRLIGLEIAPAPGVYITDLVHLGTNRPDLESVPHHFIIERSYFHGDPRSGSRRGIALNSGDTTIVDSYFADFKEVGADSQAICGWNGPGPFRIINNYLEGAGENIMFGGADPTIPDLVPSDIEIRRNHFSKPLTWRPESRPEDEPQWQVKNLLELKNARRVLIDGNLFEHNWLQAQVGFAILFTPRNQDGNSPWSVVEDVVFSNNIIRRVAAGIDLLGHDDIHRSEQAKRITIRNNLFMEIGGSWGFGRLFQIRHGLRDVTIEHNTAQTETAVFGGDTLPNMGFVFRDNIVQHNQFGFIGSDFGPGRPSIERYFPDGVIERNVLIGGNPALYPPNNFFPRTMDEVGFVDPLAGDFRLLASSAFRGRSAGGSDVGADIAAIARATNGIAGPRPRAAVLPGTDEDEESAAFWIFWGAVGLLAYTYVGYPLFLWFAARLIPAPARARPYEPTLTIVVVAHNEAERIGAKIENLLAEDYPPDKREIVVVSDGSTDDTAAIARSYPGVRVVERCVRRGKAVAFDDVLPRLSSEVVVLADTRQRFEPDALRALTAHFADPSVGAVGGQLVLTPRTDGDAGSQGVEMYWTFEKRLRWWESLLDSSVGVSGAIMAIRRDLFEPIPPDTVLDDVVIPLRIARRGYRVTFEPRARAYDRLSAAEQDEFSRKVRTLAGNFQLLGHERWVWLPWRNRLWLQTMSHKALRLALPALFLAAAVSNLFLLGEPFYQLTLAAQTAFYGLALVVGAWPAIRARVPVLVLPYTICFLLWATIVAFVRVMRGGQPATWDRPAMSGA